MPYDTSAQTFCRKIYFMRRESILHVVEEPGVDKDLLLDHMCLNSGAVLERRLMIAKINQS